MFREDGLAIVLSLTRESPYLGNTVLYWDGVLFFNPNRHFSWSKVILRTLCKRTDCARMETNTFYSLLNNPVWCSEYTRDNSIHNLYITLFTIYDTHKHPLTFWHKYIDLVKCRREKKKGYLEGLDMDIHVYIYIYIYIYICQLIQWWQNENNFSVHQAIPPLDVAKSRNHDIYVYCYLIGLELDWRRDSSVVTWRSCKMFCP